MIREGKQTFVSAERMAVTMTTSLSRFSRTRTFAEEVLACVNMSAKGEESWLVNEIGDEALI